ncbi:MAG: twitch domain-containing radical SAM protein [Bdellovibrionales bacterium]|nr:twitch domain-containing radical SAM protein [Bdellovibrionales bacterium]
MSRPLCPLPFTHLFINNAGIVNACCLTYPQYSKKDEFGENLAERSVLSVGLLAAWHSSYLKNFREKMESQQWPKTCATCFRQEETGLKSRRIQELENTAIRINSAQPVAIRTMDLRVGNVCNLACRMCSPFSSSLLYKEWKDSGATASKIISESIGSYDKIDWKNWSEIPEIWDDLLKISDSVEEINFAGGEPFLNLAHVDFLKKLVLSKRSQKIRISYNTNLTRIPSWLEPLIPEFKSIRIMVSIDGIEALGEYIRYPLKWSTFEASLTQLNDLKDRYQEKLEVAFNTTVQAYNLFGLVDLLKYLKNSPHAHLPRTTVANILQNPGYFNVANLPHEIKQAAKEQISEYFNLHTQHDSAEFLEAVLQQLNTAEFEDLSDEFRRVTKFYDQQRSQSLAAVVPEMRHFGL